MRDLRRLFRSMDFVSRHPVLKRDTKEARRFAEIYQQLGLAWEFLALQCKHGDGWRQLRDGKSACKVCGLIRGVKEQWLLLPRDGKKVVGRRTKPNSKRTFPNRKAATVVNDTIELHGAKLNVEVLNLHRSRLFRRNDILCAADRLVRLEEAGVEYRLAEHTLDIRLRPRRRGEEPPFSAFVSELPRRALKRFPVVLQYDRRGRFVGVVIFRPLSAAARKRSRKGSAATKDQRRK